MMMGINNLYTTFCFFYIDTVLNGYSTASANDNDSSMYIVNCLCPPCLVEPILEYIVEKYYILNDYDIGPRVINHNVHDRTLVILTERVYWVCTNYINEVTPSNRIFYSKLINSTETTPNKLINAVNDLITRLHINGWGHMNLTPYAIGSTTGINAKIVLGRPEFIYPFYGYQTNPLVDEAYSRLYSKNIKNDKLEDLKNMDFNLWRVGCLSV